MGLKKIKNKNGDFKFIYKFFNSKQVEWICSVDFKFIHKPFNLKFNLIKIWLH